MANFIPSPQQDAYFDWIDNGTGSAIVEAVAGAGKTTTLLEGLRRMDGSVYFGTYGKEIAKDIKAKAEEKEIARRGLFIGTAHSAGLTAWRRAYPNVRIDDDKVRNLVEDAMMRGDVYEWEKGFVTKLVAFGKQLLLPLAGGQAWFDAVDHFGLDEELPEDADIGAAIEKTLEIYQASRVLCPQVIDFGDMIYAPLSFKARFFQNDWILIDEAQDTNPARRRLYRSMLKPNGRLVAVGDSRQAIFGFTGASNNSMDLIAKEHNCILLPLTVTYRCPKAVVRFVGQWDKRIEAHPSAPEGCVRNVLPAPEGKSEPWFVTDKPGPDDMVLCRFTKPLITTAYGMLKVGHACKVEGRDIGKGLVNLARRWKVRTLDALEGRLEKYLAREVKKARAKKSETAEQAAIDRVDTLRIFIGRCRDKGSLTVDCVVAEIEALFADDVTGVTTLMTIHKAKGRERHTVYWIQGMITSELKDWEAVQEENLCIVGGTRSKDTLVLVPEQPK